MVFNFIGLVASIFQHLTGDTAVENCKEVTWSLHQQTNPVYFERTRSPYSVPVNLILNDRVHFSGDHICENVASSERSKVQE